MGYIGLSLIVVSLSFFCYKHPPTSWILPNWFRRLSIQDVGRRRHLDTGNDALGKTTSDKRSIELDGIPQIILDGEQEQRGIPASTSTHSDGEPSRTTPTITHNDEEEPTRRNPDIPQITHDAPSEPADKFLLDRKAMPPPPPPSSIKKPPPKPPVPLFNTPSSSSSPLSSSLSPRADRPVAMFPALNSHQRTSGGTNAPQRLPPPSSNPNAYLMAPPSRAASSLPNRGPPSTQTSSSSSLFPPPTHSAPPSKPSKKVLLPPGHSPLDWARLTNSPDFLATQQAQSYIRVPPSLLKTQNGRKGKEAWTVLGGKVYNITPYMKYHPGGIPELMRCAGREGTKMFGEVHPWVNWEGMLEACLVGIAVEEEVVRNGVGAKGGRGGLEDMD